MSRRRSLPGADELFRSTGGPAAAPAPGSEHAHAEQRAQVTLTPVADLPAPAEAAAPPPPPVRRGPVRAPVRRRPTAADRQPTGRERHDEKITVYVSAEELLDLEHARLTLRGDHGLAVDRGRIVREALAVVLADLDAKGESSILVRRLRGR
ncbi:MAG TPA: cobyrinic acid a,c-diamide synthase [Mycobacteriales bacterium]|nr:cobyrinic acid a,c-diamide synthase [Mycobacteriales bacterium]